MAIKKISQYMVEGLATALAGKLSVTAPQLGGALDQNGHTISGAEHANTTTAIDWRIGNHQAITLTGPITLTFTAPAAPCMLSLKIVQDGTGGRVLTLPTIKWSAGVAPTWITAANTISILSLYYDGAAYYGQAGLDFR